MALDKIQSFNRVHAYLTSNGFKENCVVGDALSLACRLPYVVEYQWPPGAVAVPDVEAQARKLARHGFRHEVAMSAPVPDATLGRLVRKPILLRLVHDGKPKARGYDDAMRQVLSYLLHPKRISVSGRFTAMLACLLGEEWTDPSFSALCITGDDCLLGQNKGDCGFDEFIGNAGDLFRNVRGVCNTAGCSEAERAWLLGRCQILRCVRVAG